MRKGKVSGGGLYTRPQRRRLLSLRTWFTAASSREVETSNTLSESPHSWIMKEISCLRWCVVFEWKSVINSWRYEVGETRSVRRSVPDLEWSHLKVPARRVVRDEGRSESGKGEESREPTAGGPFRGDM